MPKIEGLDSSIRLYAKRSRPIVQPNTEISHRTSNLFSAIEVAETIGTDLETINEWLEVGAIDRWLFGGGRFHTNYKERHSHHRQVAEACCDTILNRESILRRRCALNLPTR